MAMTVHCDIVSAEGQIFSGLVEMVIAHGELGDLGIAMGHAPLITSLKPGPITLTKQGGDREVVLHLPVGYLEFSRTWSRYLPTPCNVLLTWMKPPLRLPSRLLRRP